VIPLCSSWEKKYAVMSKPKTKMMPKRMINNHFLPESGFGWTAPRGGVVLSIVEVLSIGSVLSIVEVLSIGGILSLVEVLSVEGVLSLVILLSIVEVLSIVTHQGKECQILTRDCFRTYNIFSGPDGSFHPQY